MTPQDTPDRAANDAPITLIEHARTMVRDQVMGRGTWDEATMLAATFVLTHQWVFATDGETA